MRTPTPKPDCHPSNVGLHDAERAALTGYTSRAIKALAHLREAWCSADLNNARSIERAIAELLQGHSFREGTNRNLATLVLRHGHERGNELMTGVRHAEETVMDPRLR